MPTEAEIDEYPLYITVSAEHPQWGGMLFRMSDERLQIGYVDTTNCGEFTRKDFLLDEYNPTRGKYIEITWNKKWGVKLDTSGDSLLYHYMKARLSNRK